MPRMYSEEGKKPRNRVSQKSKVTKALRYAIEPSIKRWRRDHPLYRGTLCPVLNVALIRKNTEVDHHIRCFQQLCDEWMELEKLSYNDIQVGFDVNQKRYFLTDDHMKHHWVLFHDRHAILRYISKKANRMTADSGYRRQKRLEKLKSLAIKIVEEIPLENVDEEPSITVEPIMTCFCPTEEELQCKTAVIPMIVCQNINCVHYGTDWRRCIENNS